MAIKSGIDVIIRELSTNPKCIHGPTILFSVKNSGERYFSCSFERSVIHNCFCMQFDDFTDDILNKNNVTDKIVPLNAEVSFQQVRRTHCFYISILIILFYFRF